MGPEKSKIMENHQPDPERAVIEIPLVGNFDVSDYPSNRDLLLARLENGDHNVILECSELVYLDTTGLGVLVGALKKCRDKGGDLKLANVQSSVRTKIELTGLAETLLTEDGEQSVA